MKTHDLKTNLYVDYIPSIACVRTVTGCWHKGTHYEGTCNAFYRQGHLYDLVDGQMSINGKPSQVVPHGYDVMCPNSDGLWLAAFEGEDKVFHFFGWATRTLEVKQGREGTRLFNYRDEIGGKQFIDGRTLPNMINVLGVRIWERSDIGKELSKLGWGLDKVDIIRYFE